MSMFSVPAAWWMIQKNNEENSHNHKESVDDNDNYNYNDYHQFDYYNDYYDNYNDYNHNCPFYSFFVKKENYLNNHKFLKFACNYCNKYHIQIEDLTEYDCYLLYKNFFE